LPLAGKEEGKRDQAGVGPTEVMTLAGHVRHDSRGRPPRQRGRRSGQVTDCHLARFARMASPAQLTNRSFRRAVTELGARHEELGAIVRRHGVPEFWFRPAGFATLLLLILEQ